MKYIIVGLTGYEHEVSKKEFYFHLTLDYFVIISLGLVACRVLFEIIRGY